MKDSFEAELDKEIDRRIKIIESDDYSRIPEMKPRDFILPIVLFFASLTTLVIYYNFL